MDENKIIPYIGPIFRFCCKRLSNRYARFIDAQSKTKMILAEAVAILNVAEYDYCYVDEEATEHKYETVFRYLHTLSSEYRNNFVDYYIGEMSIRTLSKKYSLPETTIKWRLNTGRRKIRNRIGENSMDKVYRRINWNKLVATDLWIPTDI